MHDYAVCGIRRVAPDSWELLLDEVGKEEVHDAQESTIAARGATGTVDLSASCHSPVTMDQSTTADESADAVQAAAQPATSRKKKSKNKRKANGGSVAENAADDVLLNEPDSAGTGYLSKKAIRKLQRNLEAMAEAAARAHEDMMIATRAELAAATSAPQPLDCSSSGDGQPAAASLSCTATSIPAAVASSAGSSAGSTPMAGASAPIMSSAAPPSTAAPAPLPNAQQALTSEERLQVLDCIERADVAGLKAFFVDHPGQHTIPTSVIDKAVKLGKPEIVTKLLAHGGDLMPLDSRWPILQAVRACDVDMTRTLAVCMPPWQRRIARDEQGSLCSLLHEACKLHHHAMVAMMLTDLHHHPGFVCNGQTAMECATHAGAADVIALLNSSLQAGKLPSQTGLDDKKSIAAYKDLCRLRKDRVKHLWRGCTCATCKYMIDIIQPETPDSKALVQLLKEAVVVEAAGGTKAAQYPEGSLALLIANGANVDVQDANGMTALMTAASMDKPAVVEQLLAAGVQLEVRDFYGHSALHYAAKVASARVIQQLLAAGCPAELHSSFNITQEALDTHAREKLFDRKKKRSKDALMSATILGGESPLELMLRHAPAEAAIKEAAKLLLDAGATNPMAADSYKQGTTLNALLDKAYASVADMLMKYSPVQDRAVDKRGTSSKLKAAAAIASPDTASATIGGGDRNPLLSPSVSTAAAAASSARDGGASPPSSPAATLAHLAGFCALSCCKLDWPNGQISAHQLRMRLGCSGGHSWMWHMPDCWQVFVLEVKARGGSDPGRALLLGESLACRVASCPCRISHCEVIEGPLGGEKVVRRISPAVEPTAPATEIAAATNVTVAAAPSRVVSASAAAAATMAACNASASASVAALQRHLLAVDSRKAGAQAALAASKAKRSSDKTAADEQPVPTAAVAVAGDALQASVSQPRLPHLASASQLQLSWGHPAWPTGGEDNKPSAAQLVASLLAELTCPEVPYSSSASTSPAIGQCAPWLATLTAAIVNALGVPPTSAYTGPLNRFQLLVLLNQLIVLGALRRGHTLARDVLQYVNPASSSMSKAWKQSQREHQQRLRKQAASQKAPPPHSGSGGGSEASVAPSTPAVDRLDNTSLRASDQQKSVATLTWSNSFSPTAVISNVCVSIASSSSRSGANSSSNLSIGSKDSAELEAHPATADSAGSLTTTASQARPNISVATSAEDSEEEDGWVQATAKTFRVRQKPQGVPKHKSAAQPSHSKAARSAPTAAVSATLQPTMPAPPPPSRAPTSFASVLLRNASVAADAAAQPASATSMLSSATSSTLNTSSSVSAPVSAACSAPNTASKVDFSAGTGAAVAEPVSLPRSAWGLAGAVDTTLTVSTTAAPPFPPSSSSTTVAQRTSASCLASVSPAARIAARSAEVVLADESAPAAHAAMLTQPGAQDGASAPAMAKPAPDLAVGTLHSTLHSGMGSSSAAATVWHAPQRPASPSWPVDDQFATPTATTLQSSAAGAGATEALGSLYSLFGPSSVQVGTAAAAGSPPLLAPTWTSQSTSSLFSNPVNPRGPLAPYMPLMFTSAKTKPRAATPLTSAVQSLPVLTSAVLPSLGSTFASSAAAHPLASAAAALPTYRPLSSPWSAAAQVPIAANSAPYFPNNSGLQQSHLQADMDAAGSQLLLSLALGQQAQPLPTAAHRLFMCGVNASWYYRDSGSQMSVAGPCLPQQMVLALLSGQFVDDLLVCGVEGEVAVALGSDPTYLLPFFEPLAALLAAVRAAGTYRPVTLADMREYWAQRVSANLA